MKAKKKRVGTKAQIRAVKERERRIATAIFLAFILLIIIFSAYFTYTFLNQSPDQSLIEPTLQFKPENPNPQLKAAIIDHLSLTAPNQTFIQTAAHILTEVDYTVDYYSGENVTVEFYKNLPTHGYSLIILRVHSTATKADSTEGPVILFTSERYDRTKYVYEQLTNQLIRVIFSQYEWERGITYFGIQPPFITQSMNGRFQNTIIIMMGCEGLDNILMAEAFVEKGAKAYISWTQPVSASHTDTATTQLLQNLLIKKQTIEQATDNTMEKVGIDPAYESLLTYYPFDARMQTIENIKSNG
jgi:hypothetical protein